MRCSILHFSSCSCSTAASSSRFISRNFSISHCQRGLHRQKRCKCPEPHTPNAGKNGPPPKLPHDSADPALADRVLNHRQRENSQEESRAQTRKAAVTRKE
eukprot:1209002-Rhodomonas_salina.2